MAAAIPALPQALYSLLFGDASQWENFAPDYTVLSNYFGNGAPASSATQCRDALAGLATRTPVVVALVSDTECDKVYVAHTLTLFPVDVSNPTPLDGLLTGLIGNSMESAVAVVLPQAFFGLTANNTRALEVAAIQGPDGHGAAVPVFRTGPHGAAAPDTSSIRARRAMILPPAQAALALAGASADGSYTLLGFFNRFLQGPLSSADPLEVAAIGPLVQWWRLASTNLAGGTSVVSSPLLLPTSPGEMLRLAAWSSRVKSNELRRVGLGGPALSNAAFALGVSELKTSLEGTHRATLEFERSRQDKSFADTHGADLAQYLHRLCGVNRDEDLPDVHTLLLRTPRGRVYAVLSSLFATRAHESEVGLSMATAPVATTKLVDEVFRNYQPGDDGLEFGKGLSPFSVICKGHAGVAEALKQVHKASMVLEGASTTLADAQALIADDTRFPTRAYVAVEKLCGWSVVIDVFHGPNHPVAVSVRHAVHTLSPFLQRLEGQNEDTPGAGIELLCRILYDMQQDYFFYLHKLGLGQEAVVPMFDKVLGLVATQRAQGLTSLPTHWYTMVGCPKPRQLGVTSTPATAPPEMRVAASGVSAVNSHSDRRLVTRFKDSGHPTITAMVGDRKLEFPKQGGQAICVQWALKGTCSAACKRASQHVRYNADTVKALHKFMDDCGVAPSKQ
jgi:hypothetical protein